MKTYMQSQQRPETAEASAFHTVCQEQIRGYWSIKGAPIDPALDKLVSSTISTKQLIDTLRSFEPNSPDILVLLDKAEAKLNQIKHIKTNGRSQTYRVTVQLRLVLVQIAANLFKLLKAAEKEWEIVSQEETEVEDFVMVE